jgi:hypothetical protein
MMWVKMKQKKGKINKKCKKALSKMKWKKIENQKKNEKDQNNYHFLNTRRRHFKEAGGGKGRK